MIYDDDASPESERRGLKDLADVMRLHDASPERFDDLAARWRHMPDRPADFLGWAADKVRAAGTGLAHIHARATTIEGEQDEEWPEWMRARYGGAGGGFDDWGGGPGGVGW